MGLERRIAIVASIRAVSHGRREKGGVSLHAPPTLNAPSLQCRLSLRLLPLPPPSHSTTSSTSSNYPTSPLLTPSGSSPVLPSASHLVNAGPCSPFDVLPSSFDPTPTNNSDDPQLQRQLPPVNEKSAVANADGEALCNWAAFVHAYAVGRLDCLCTPHSPRSQLQAPSHLAQATLGSTF
ncbi:uncharacterized protein LAESUDRAFT_472678 [Laetiporus sulphureus 93-53]|uniref:Uncharacterized protein n=1 Tax=Laetiporus sulphureus 93-53 TaxID=1314785 RepID=A0A165GBI5_9APHY|nr:uncharacterized protein LAESUDRAFT_472678 [Laetiporus sulphureus 93-53]KZT10114.1 hypothetical protein LAESUDRAFT_472678 [Laetiporus sulphureus 93-53]